ncbi:MAG: MoaD/ThiS family protein [Novosphingobium sp.]
MVKVSLDRSLAAEWFGGRDVVEAEAGSVLQLVDALDRMAPGFAEIAPVRTVFAVDGEVTADWSVAINDASEVFLLPRIGGG